MTDLGVLFHGSERYGLTTLKPSPSKVLDGEEAVFATNKFWLALVFAARTTSADLDFGYLNGVPYVAEMYSGAFTLLRKSDASIYVVAASGFSRDSRLGMLNHEFVCRAEVPVLEEVPMPGDILVQLREQSVRLLQADQREKFLAGE